MKSIAKREFHFNCPGCKAPNRATLEQVVNQETVICSGCKKNIKLNNKNGSTKQAVSSVDKSIEDFKDKIKRLER